MKPIENTLYEIINHLLQTQPQLSPIIKQLADSAYYNYLKTNDMNQLSDKKWNAIIDAEVRSVRYDEITYENKKKLNFTKSEITKWLINGNLNELVQGENIHKKGLEFFFSAKILNLEHNDIIMDAAGGRSHYLKAVNKNSGLSELYLTDHIYSGVKKNEEGIFIVGGDISSIQLDNETLSKIACHHAFEHFQEDKDLAFIKEAYRLLKEFGILVIIPLFLTDKYVECWNIDTNKHFDLNSRVIIDKTASIPGADDDGHFARFYNIESFISRIIRPSEELGFRCEVIECQIDDESIPNMNSNFGSVLNRPLRALKLQKCVQR